MRKVDEIKNFMADIIEYICAIKTLKKDIQELNIRREEIQKENEFPL